MSWVDNKSQTTQAALLIENFSTSKARGGRVVHKGIKHQSRHKVERFWGVEFCRPYNGSERDIDEAIRDINLKKQIGKT